MKFLDRWVSSAYLDICNVVTLDRSDASSLVEFDLPHAAQIGQEILDELASGDVPHFEGPVGTRNDLLCVVLEAGDGACVSSQDALAFPVFWIPDSKG